MYSNMKCPICGSINLSIEKRIDGNVICSQCHHSGKRKEFEVKFTEVTLIPIVTYEQVRQELGMWSRAARQLFRTFVTQREEVEQRLNKKISDQEQLIRLYQQLATLRNDQLKDVPHIQRGTAMELDVIVCEKIKKLKIKMGLEKEE